MLTIGPLKKLGTVWWFELFDQNESDRALVTDRLVREMDRFERAYSRFLPDSQLSTLNTTGVFVSPGREFRELLEIGLRAYRDTNGVFNMAVGSYLEAAGYNATMTPEKDGDRPPVPELPSVLSLTPEQVSLGAGTHVDFGGFGKGYLIDHLAKLLRETFSAEQFLINGGGDMFATHEAGKPLTIELQHPVERVTMIGSLPLFNMGFAASSPYVRRWQGTTKEEQHLVGGDGKSAVFVVAASAMEADIWATTLAIDPLQVPPPTVRWWQWTEEQGLVDGSEL